LLHPSEEILAHRGNSAYFSSEANKCEHQTRQRSDQNSENLTVGNLYAKIIITPSKHINHCSKCFRKKLIYTIFGAIIMGFFLNIIYF
jgi:hypothetical protein